MTEDNVVWWVASLTVGAGAIPAGYLIVYVIDRVEQRRLPANGPARIVMARVLTSDLAVLIGKLAKADIPFDGSELRIFSGDGRYMVSDRGKRWRKELIGWARRGLRIRYILLEADEEVRREMIELKTKMGDRFDVRTLNDGAIPHLARELDTCHPTVFLGNDGRSAAWIEGFHPRSSAHAYDVEYISPHAMQQSRSAKHTFDHYAKKLDTVLENSRPLVAA